MKIKIIFIISLALMLYLVANFNKYSSANVACTWTEYRLDTFFKRFSYKTDIVHYNNEYKECFIK